MRIVLILCVLFLSQAAFATGAEIAEGFCCVHVEYFSTPNGQQRVCSVQPFKQKQMNLLKAQFIKALKLFPEYIKSLSLKSSDVQLKPDLLVCIGYADAHMREANIWAESFIDGTIIDIRSDALDEDRQTIAHELEHMLMDQYIKKTQSMLEVYQLHFNKEKNESLARGFEEFYKNHETP